MLPAIRRMPGGSLEAHMNNSILALLAALLSLSVCATVLAADPPPNLVMLYADDLGYGDLGCYGHPTIRTPRLDRMAVEGMRFTQFYSAAPVCSPSREALMTGRLPVRSGVTGVLFQYSAGGLPDSEITIAQVLKRKGYATACIGKWHLGHLPQYLPTRRGFDSYLGIPYSNDMDRWRDGKGVPLLRDEEIVEEPVVQETLTPRYTEAAIAFIRKNRERPFFLYLPYTYPHVPLHASEAGKGRSARGLYGDVVQEIDTSVGQILDCLAKERLAGRTLVIFSSDNGPWLSQNLNGGSAGLLRDGKGTTWEGGMREPAIAWWPGRIQPGVSLEMTSTLDILPTFASLAGTTPPSDRPLDGYDISPVLLGKGPSPRRVMFYYQSGNLRAYRKGPYKLHVMTTTSDGKKAKVKEDVRELYNLEEDPSEKYNLAADHPEIVADLLKDMEMHTKGLVPAPSQMTARIQTQPAQ